jgi:hypothetical protein
MVNLIKKTLEIPPYIVGVSLQYDCYNINLGAYFVPPSQCEEPILFSCPLGPPILYLVLEQGSFLN